ncbi:polyprotein of Ty1/Copia retrotransposon [Cycloclasticus sp.]|uniref:Ty1/Copia family ribonuclease HI n=1 Tax=Cycloclasticus sp. TaxID=2024830 RepID=UPI000C1228F5|nr:polyprotein of Ty1/Copia retrotransposon [Cycloclasticus sp.]PHR49344.1 MAG: hypothetical protein COA48_07905 [Cycloclasticus sp.]
MVAEAVSRPLDPKWPNDFRNKIMLCFVFLLVNSMSNQSFKVPTSTEHKFSALVDSRTSQKVTRAIKFRCIFEHAGNLVEAATRGHFNVLLRRENAQPLETIWKIEPIANDATEAEKRHYNEKCVTLSLFIRWSVKDDADIHTAIMTEESSRPDRLIQAMFTHLAPNNPNNGAIKKEFYRHGLRHLHLVAYDAEHDESVSRYLQMLRIDLHISADFHQFDAEFKQLSQSIESVTADLRSGKPFANVSWFGKNEKRIIADSTVYPDIASISSKLTEFEEEDEKEEETRLLNGHEEIKSSTVIDKDSNAALLARIAVLEKQVSRPTTKTNWCHRQFSRKGCRHGINGTTPALNPTTNEMDDKCKFSHRDPSDAPNRGRNQPQTQYQRRGNPIDAKTGKQMLCLNCDSHMHFARSPDCPMAGKPTRDRIDALQDEIKRLKQSPHEEAREPKKSRNEWGFGYCKYVAELTRFYNHNCPKMAKLSVAIIIALVSGCRNIEPTTTILLLMLIIFAPTTTSRCNTHHNTKNTRTKTKKCHVSQKRGFRNRHRPFRHGRCRQTSHCRKSDQDMFRINMLRIASTTKNESKRRRCHNQPAGESRALFDSGCNATSGWHKKQFHNLKMLDTPRLIMGAGDIPHKIMGIGTLRYTVTLTDGHEHTIYIPNARYIPSFDEIYLSSHDMTELGYEYHGSLSAVIIITPTKGVIQTSVNNGLPYLYGHTYEEKEKINNIQNMKEKELKEQLQNPNLSHDDIQKVRLELIQYGTYAYKQNDKYHKVHRKLGHAGHRATVAYMRKHGMIRKHDKVLQAWCERCALTRIQKGKIPRSAQKRTIRPKTFCKWSCDISGPHTTGLNGERYYCVFVEHTTGTWSIHPLKTLQDMPQVLCQFANKIQKQMRNLNENKAEIEIRDLHLRTDCASYFTSRVFREQADKLGIELTVSAPYSQFRNGRSENAVKHINRMIKSMLRDADLENRFWPLAARHCETIHDIILKTDGRDAPSVLRKESRLLPHIPPFGTPGVLKREESIEEPKGEFPDKGMRGIFVGWCHFSGCYMMLAHHKGRYMTYRRRDVCFNDEHEFPDTEISEDGYDTDDCDDYVYENPPPDISEENIDEINIDEGNENADQTEENTSNEDENILDEIDLDFYYDIQTGTLINKLGKRLSDDKRMKEKIHGITDPSEKIYYNVKSAKNAFDSIYPGAVDEAVNIEMKALHKHNLREVDPNTVSEDENVQRLICLIHDKHENGEHEKIKCRVVFDGSSEKEGIHYDQNTSSNPRAAAVRLHYALSPMGPDEECFDGDVSTAYLRGKLPPAPNGKRRLCRLQKDLDDPLPNGQQRTYEITAPHYGMKAAGKIWMDHLRETLRKYNYTQCKYEPTFYKAKDIRILVFTDNIMVRALPQAAATFRKHMESEFGDMKWRTTTKSIGYEIKKSSDGFFCLSQGYFINKMMNVFKITQKDSVPPTPLPEGTYINKNDRSPYDLGLCKKMQSLLGHLNYIGVFSRPDIMMTTSALGQVCISPQDCHINWAHRTIRYLKGTKDYGIQYSRPQRTACNTLFAHADASFAKENNYRSRSSMIIYMNNGPIDWSSNVQSMVSQSTFEAELQSLNQCTRRVMYLRHLLEELGYPQTSPTPIMQDASACVRYANNDNVTQRNLHLNVQMQYSREQVYAGNVQVLKTSTLDMSADIGTKALPAKDHQRHLNRILSAP